MTDRAPGPSARPPLQSRPGSGADAPAPALVLGSTNPVKLRALEVVAAIVLPDFRIASAPVDSGVDAQPRSDLDTVRGAATRARAALDALAGAAIGVGIESGVDRLDGSTFCFTWAVAVARDGAMGRGCSARIELPAEVAELLEHGLTLEEALVARGERAGVGGRGGAMGVLTAGAVTRADATIHALHFALARFGAPIPPEP
jgi:inosine/xanthosine triphosphatase